MVPRASRLLAILVLVLSVFSISCASSSKATSGGSSPSAMVAAAGGAASLYQSLGGSKGVTALASQFGANLKANALVTQALSAADILTAQNGLTNSIAKAGGQPTVGNGTDLLGALNGKGLNPAAIGGVGQSLMNAGTSQGLKPDQLAALSSLWSPISKSLLGGK